MNRRRVNPEEGRITMCFDIHPSYAPNVARTRIFYPGAALREANGSPLWSVQTCLRFSPMRHVASNSSNPTIPLPPRRPAGTRSTRVPDCRRSLRERSELRSDVQRRLRALRRMQIGRYSQAELAANVAVAFGRALRRVPGGLHGKCERF